MHRPKTPTDVNLGRAVFAKTCLNCHTLYGVGGKVGPEITGANRGNIDYLLENILDPSCGHSEGVRRDADRHHTTTARSSASSRAR